MYCVLRPGVAGEEGSSLPVPGASVALPAEPVSRPHREGKISTPSHKRPPFTSLSEIEKGVEWLALSVQSSYLLPLGTDSAGWPCDSPHICPIALANLKGKPNEMFGEVDCRGHSTSKRAGGLRRRVGLAELSHICPPALMGFHFFWHHQ